jgi:hypothetical protein
MVDPVYGFAVTKGYPVSAHYERLPSLAPAPRIDSHLELYAKLSGCGPCIRGRRRPSELNCRSHMRSRRRHLRDDYFSGTACWAFSCRDALILPLGTGGRPSVLSFRELAPKALGQPAR